MKIDKMKKQKCDYCEKEAKYCREFLIRNETDKEGQGHRWQKFACEEHIDYLLFRLLEKTI